MVLDPPMTPTGEGFLMVGFSHRQVIMGVPSLASVLMVEVLSRLRKVAGEEGVMPLFATAMVHSIFLMSKVGGPVPLGLRSNLTVTVRMISLLKDLIVSHTTEWTLLQSTRMPDFSS